MACMIHHGNLKWLERKIAAVEAGEEDAYTIARCAVFMGLLMIGGIRSREIHHPVPATEHSYIDLTEGGTAKTFIKNGMALRATAVADVGIACALWGSFNDHTERRERAAEFMPPSPHPRRTGDFGWSKDTFKQARRRNQLFMLYADGDRYMLPWYDTIPDSKSNGLSEFNPGHALDLSDLSRASGIAPREEGAMRLHARPEFINAARNPDNPLRGYIDFIDGDIEGEGAFRRVPHEIGSWVTNRSCHTLLTMPIIGNRDLPLDINPTNYDDPRALSD